ncbi:MAG: hypothetical protein ACFE96_13340 [Candidatus Hermodarchaeota archaeon]
MGKRSKNKSSNIRLREIGLAKRLHAKKWCLDKFERAEHRRRLKVRIKLRLKELTQLINLKS